MNEFELIAKIKKDSSLFRKSPAARTGIGDDCAVLPKTSKTDLVITTDLLVEDIDFRLRWAKPAFIGHKALAVSLSDVAAMGAKPVWAMLSIGIPEKIWKTNFVDEFYDGWFNLAKTFDVELIGGDVSKTPDKIVIDSIATGETKKEKAILRSNAKPGDLIFVTGRLGGAAAGLRLLEGGVLYDDSIKTWQKNLLLRQLKPLPNVSAGKKLGAAQIPGAMIDLSDGLSSDLRHLCRESQVGAKVYAGKIPLHTDLYEMTTSPEERLDYVLNGGEDFELLFTVNREKAEDLEKNFKKYNFSHIGEITPDAEIIELISNSQSSILEAKGFRHF